MTMEDQTGHSEMSPMVMRDHEAAPMDKPLPTHSLGPNDPLNPQNWPLHRKLYGSAVSWFYAFAV
jgi:DHA1 family multidrug resistance protein-like MFS transporter